MDATEKREREEFVVEVCELMRDRLVGEEIALHFGWNPHEVRETVLGSPVMRMFRQGLFARVVPNIKKLGLLTPRVREAYAKLDLLRFEERLTAVGGRNPQQAFRPVIGRHHRIRSQPGRINDPQADLRGGQPRADARKRGADIPCGPAPAVGNRVAKETVRIAADDDRAPAFRITRLLHERVGDAVCLDAIRDDRLRALRRGRNHRKNRGQQSPAGPQAYASRKPWFFSGSVRTRRPVAAKTALHRAGATGPIDGSPMPPQNPPLGTSRPTTLGM